jgi:hypothetical protein
MTGLELETDDDDAESKHRESDSGARVDRPRAVSSPIRVPRFERVGFYRPRHGGRPRARFRADVRRLSESDPNLIFNSGSPGARKSATLH